MPAYHVVEMPILASPCRRCHKVCHTKTRCQILKVFKKGLEGEFSGFVDPSNQWLYCTDIEATI